MKPSLAALYLDLKVIPQSGRRSFSLHDSGQLICHLTAAPDKGKANKELIQILSEALSLPQSMIEIVSGFNLRHKRVRILSTLPQETIMKLLLNNI
jgi:uncharacterized protein